MKSLLILGVVMLSACSTTPRHFEPDQDRYCNTSSEYRLQNGDVSSSEVLVQCTDKPKVNHYMKDAGVYKNCRWSETRVYGKLSKSFLCQKDNSDEWYVLPSSIGSY